jgi:hypothetical protein
MTYRSSSKMVTIDQFLEELCPLNLAIFEGFYSFPDYIPQCVQLFALKFCTSLYVYDVQIKFKDGCYRLTFGRVIPLELRHFEEFYCFPDFLPQSAATTLKLCIMALYL